MEALIYLSIFLKNCFTDFSKRIFAERFFRGSSSINTFVYFLSNIFCEISFKYSNEGPKSVDGFFSDGSIPLGFFLLSFADFCSTFTYFKLSFLQLWLCRTIENHTLIQSFKFNISICFHCCQ